MCTRRRSSESSARASTSLVEIIKTSLFHSARVMSILHRESEFANLSYRVILSYDTSPMHIYFRPYTLLVQSMIALTFKPLNALASNTVNKSPSSFAKLSV